MTGWAGVRAGWLAAAFTAGALLLSACGSSDEPAQLTRAEFIEQGNTICKQRLKEKDRLIQEKFKELEGTGGSSTKHGEEAVDAALPAMDALAQELADLPAPSKDEATVNRLVKQMNAALKQLEDDPGSVLKGDPFDPAAKTARSYGLLGCALI